MCRLCAVTATDLPTLDLIDRFMLLNQLDEGQFDGCGISNGDVITKSALPYCATMLAHFNDDFAMNNGIIAHVRKASPQTGRTRDESHPWEFDIAGKKLIAAHNGYFMGTGWSAAGEPNSDSWRAFKKLAELLNATDDKIISKSVFEEWLANYEELSTIGLLLMYDGEIYVYRHSKPLFISEFGNGYVINTGAKPLVMMAEYIRQRFWGEASMIDPVAIPENTLLRMKPAEKDIHITELNVVWKPKPVYHKSETTAITPMSDYRDKRVNTAAIQNDAQTQTTMINALTDDARIQDVVMKIKATANPMRSSLWLGWLQASYGITIPKDILALYASTSEDDFNLFKESVGKWTKRQSRLIQAWNKLVPKTSDKMLDIELHLESFGCDWFWMDDFFLNEAITDDQAVQLLEAEICRSEAFIAMKKETYVV